MTMPIDNSKAVAEHLGPPSQYHYRSGHLDPDSMIRQIELAESALHFGAQDAESRYARFNYARVLKTRLNDVELHHKVWQLLIATRREAEAYASSSSICERAMCDYLKAAHHACVLTSATLLPSMELRLETARPGAAAGKQSHGHIIELPQPDRPAHLAPERVGRDNSSRERTFFAFNPAIAPIATPRSLTQVISQASTAYTPSQRHVVFFRYSNVRSMWTMTSPKAWQRARDWEDWRAALSEGHVDSDGVPQPASASTSYSPAAPGPAPLSADLPSTVWPGTRDAHSTRLDLQDAQLEFDALIERAEEVAEGMDASERWQRLMDLTAAQSATPDEQAPADDAEGGSDGNQGPVSPVSKNASRAAADDESDDEDELDVFDVLVADDGDELLVPSASAAHNEELMQSFISRFEGVRGGYSTIGYILVERSLGGRLRLVGDPRWLRMEAPFAPCGECDEDDPFAWLAMSPAMCVLVTRIPALSISLFVLMVLGGLMQMASGVRKTYAQRRVARIPFLRGLLLLMVPLAFRVCSDSGRVESCTPSAKPYLQGHPREGLGGNETTFSGHAPKNTSSEDITKRLRALNQSSRTEGLKLHPTDVSLAREGRSPHIEYDGYEDGRVIVRSAGQLYLLANHEDCHGRRRLVLVRLRGDAAKGTLEQDASWVLRVDGGGTSSDEFELADNEKNWSPFVEGGILYLSYSIEPHVVLRCAWSGGSCRVAYNTSSDVLQAYRTLGQGLRGGTPYVRLPNGDLLSALHVKDTHHMPALYSTALYIIEGRPPFRVRSISPKLCLSEKSMELASSVRCALQYVVGLSIDVEANLALLSFGEFDRTMMLAALPLNAVIAMAQTLRLPSDDGDELSVADCIT